MTKKARQSGGKTLSLSLRLTPEEHKELKIFAVQQEISIQDLLKKSAWAFMKRESGEASPGKRTKK